MRTWNRFYLCCRNDVHIFHILVSLWVRKKIQRKMKKKSCHRALGFFFLLLFIQKQISLTAEPAGPLKPRGPKSPLGPGKPRSPGWPGGPVMVVVAPEMASDPGGPGGPRGPASPGSPGAPWNPTPMFPFGPGLPGRPWSPFEIEWFFFSIWRNLEFPPHFGSREEFEIKEWKLF